jgi:epoxyqueuosine reductase
MNEIKQLYNRIKTEATHLGFTHMGVAPALPQSHFENYLAWVNAGHHADMNYLARPDALAKRADPRQIMEGCLSIICLAMPYNQPQKPLDTIPQGSGRVSSYALTQDYHDLIWEKLAKLEKFIRNEVKGDVMLKSYVDTGPILERTFASLAGLGTQGKNTCLIIPREGSFFFLAEILTDLPLPTDQPFTTDLCKNCHRCIDACPTECILPNRTIDANRCISYLTIENKGDIPDDLKPKIGDWFFGCDICQVVCPHNFKNTQSSDALGEPLLPELINLLDLFTEDQTNLIENLQKTPLTRAKRRGLLRNAAVVLGNQKYQKALPLLEQAAQTESDPIVLDACNWAIDQIRE